MTIPVRQTLRHRKRTDHGQSFTHAKPGCSGDLTTFEPDKTRVRSFLSATYTHVTRAERFYKLRSNAADLPPDWHTWAFARFVASCRGPRNDSNMRVDLQLGAPRLAHGMQACLPVIPSITDVQPERPVAMLGSCLPYLTLCGQSHR